MRSRLVPTVAAFAIAALTFSLGQWQAGRAAHKEALHAEAMAAGAAAPIAIGAQMVEPAQIDQHVVTVRGEFIPRSSILLDNRTYQGEAGFYVLTALRIDGGRAVVVNRGWMPALGAGRAQVEPPVPPAGPQQITGHASAQISSYMALRGAAKGELGGIWPNFSFDAYAQASGLDLQPIVVQQASAADDGLVRDWPQPGTDSAKNVAYAIQWYAMSALSIGLWLWFGVLRPRQAEKAKRNDAGQSTG